MTLEHMDAERNRLLKMENPFLPTQSEQAKVSTNIEPTAKPQLSALLAHLENQDDTKLV